MPTLLKSSTVVLLLPLLSHIATSVFPFNRKPQVPAVMMSMVQIQQVKERILRGLNMTAAPRMLAPNRTKFKLRRPNQNASRQPNVSMILSEASDDERKDTVNFKLSSSIRAQVQDIELAILFVTLRSNCNTAKLKMWHDVDHERQLDNLSKRGIAKERRRKKCNRLGSSSYPEDVQEHIQVNTNATVDSPANVTNSKIKGNKLNAVSTNFINSNNGARSPEQEREEGDRKSRQLRGLKPWRVKVVVKAVDPETGKRRRIAVEKMSVKGSSAMAVSLSKDVLVAAAASSNHTLQLQMTCKRCKGRVHIEKVYKTLRRTSKQEAAGQLRLNPHRPYLFIATGSNAASTDFRNSLREAKADSPNDIARARAKRDTSSGSSEKMNPSPNNTLRYPASSYFSCCAESMNATFQQLGIDNVLYPKNVSILYCAFPCKINDSNIINNATVPARKQRNFKINYHSSSIKERECVFSRKHNTSGSVNHVRSLYAVENVPPTEHQAESPISGQLTGNCVLIIVQPIDVIVLRRANTVTLSNLNDVRYLACDCPDRR
ncbi:hypothetical protein BsWGS_04066 [Bradybaena similaris]